MSAPRTACGRKLRGARDKSVWELDFGGLSPPFLGFTNVSIRGEISG